MEPKEYIATTLSDVCEFRHLIGKESDRGCALMAAAFLDEELKKLINKYFVDDEKIASILLNQSAPLGAFSSRIDLAYLLGLIGKKARNDLHLIRKIRNDFGHVPTKLTFDDPKIASRCKELYHDQLDIRLKPRTKFSRVVMGILALIHVELYAIKHRKKRFDVIIDDGTREKFKKLTSEILEKLLSGNK